MFGQRGIGLDDLEQIEREEFVHYVEAARALGSSVDWARFREELIGALTTALGLDFLDGDIDNEDAEARIVQRQQRARVLLDELNSRHEAATDWSGFTAALWSNRETLRR